MMDRLRAEVRKQMERMDELALRERALLFIGILALMYIVTVQFVIQPLTDQRTRLEKELKTKRDQVQAAEQQIQATLGGGFVEADVDKRARLAALQEQLRGLDVELGKTTSGLVTPKEMARLVEQFLARNRGLQVVKVESIPAEPLLGESVKAAVNAVANTAAGATTAGPLIYKHGLRLELRGSYFDILGYLRGLEALPWRVFWGEVSLQAEQYPVSKLTLVIYTLSTQEGWIGI
jgi:MSHA biogenesis protein MshJ